MLDIETMTLLELKELAKEHNLKNISKLKKEELITVLKQIVNKPEIEEIKEETNKQERQYDENGEPIVDYKLTSDGDEIVEGILDILPDGYGFLRGENFLSSEKDVYISMIQIRRFRLDTGDIIKGISRFREGEKFPSLIFVGEVNGEHPEKAMKRRRFDELTPIYPNKRLKLETRSKRLRNQNYRFNVSHWKRAKRNDCSPTKSWKNNTIKKSSKQYYNKQSRNRINRIINR